MIEFAAATPAGVDKCDRIVFIASHWSLKGEVAHKRNSSMKRSSSAVWKQSLGGTLISLLILGLVGNVFADDITGKVFDATGKPVSGIKIVAANPPDKPLTQAVTGSDGGYMLSGLPDGTTYLTLDPSGAGVQGSTVLAAIDNQGLNVAWNVSPKAPAIATATKPAQNPDPPGCGTLNKHDCAVAWIVGGTGAAAFATLGGLALAGVFDGPTTAHR